MISDRETPEDSPARALRCVRIAAVVVVSLLAAGGCGESSPPQAQEPAAEQATADLPEIAAIGGVQDVWAFDFGMDADREAVRAQRGEPRARAVSEESDRAGEPDIVVWRYDGLEITFLIDAANETEYLLSARISDPSVPIRGGLEVGMQLDRATELLGEPRVIEERSLVYFYRNTTIELVVSDDVVEAIHLARALP
ncbi:MAG: hypothetical protein ACOCVO_01000 [bacterium]